MDHARVTRSPHAQSSDRRGARSRVATRWVLLGLMVLAWIPAPTRGYAREAAAAQATRPISPPRAVWSAIVSVARGHDDNPLQLTRQNLELFATRPGPPRFLVSQVGDMATTAQGSLRWRGRLVRRRETRVEAGAEFRRNDHDRVADRRQYSLTVGQELTAARRSLLGLELWATRIPGYYLGEITDLDESVAAGTRLRHSLRYAQTAYGLRLRRSLLRGHVEALGGLERIDRRYSDHFKERMNYNDQFRLGFEVRPFRRWDAAARVLWIRGTLTARGDLPDTLGVNDTDISYRHDGVGVGLTLPWGRGPWRGRLDASLQPEVRSYSTRDKFDILRFGRENHRRTVQVRVTQRVAAPLDVISTWSRLRSVAEFHQGITFPASQTDFAEEQFSIALRAHWDAPAR